MFCVNNKTHNNNNNIFKNGKVVNIGKVGRCCEDKRKKIDIINRFKFLLLKSIHLKKYLKLINENSRHQNLYSDLIDCDMGLQINLDNLLHLIAVIVGMIILKEECVYCKNNNSQENMYFEITKRKHVYINVLNIFYGLNMNITRKFFSILKLAINTGKGIYAYDLNSIILEYIKYNNIFNAHDYSHFEYMGILYRADSDLTIYSYAKDCVYLGKNNDKYCGIIYSVNTHEEPEHWCGYFYDPVNRILFFYNSLAKPNQLDFTLYNNFYKLDNCTRFVYNTCQQQFKNNLCGIFAARFLFLMYEKCNTDEREGYFKQEFDTAINKDDESEQFQKNYVFNTNKSLYLFNSPI